MGISSPNIKAKHEIANVSRSALGPFSSKLWKPTQFAKFSGDPSR